MKLRIRVKCFREWQAGQVEVVEGTVDQDGTEGLCTAEGAKPAAVSSLLHFERDLNTKHHRILERNGAVSSWESPGWRASSMDNSKHSILTCF